MEHILPRSPQQVLTDKFISDSWPPELWENTCCVSYLLCVKAAPANQYRCAGALKTVSLYPNVKGPQCGCCRHSYFLILRKLLKGSSWVLLISVPCMAPSAPQHNGELCGMLVPKHNIYTRHTACTWKRKSWKRHGLCSEKNSKVD